MTLFGAPQSIEVVFASDIAVADFVGSLLVIEVVFMFITGVCVCCSCCGGRVVCWEGVCKVLPVYAEEMGWQCHIMGYGLPLQK